MPTLTAYQLQDIRDQIGLAQPPSDADLQVLYDRYLGTVGVVRSVLRRRLATLLSQPSAFAIPGDYSQSTTTNIVELQKHLAALAGLPDDSDLMGVVSVYVLERTDPAR